MITGAVKLLESILGPSAPSGSEYVSFLCPFPHGGKREKNPSFTANVRTGRCKCYRCQETWSLKRLLELVGYAEAYTVWKESGQLEETGFARRSRMNLQSPNGVLPNACLGMLSLLPPTVIQEQGLETFDPETLAHFQVGFDEGLKRIVYPLRTFNGDLYRLHYRRTDLRGSRYAFYQDYEFEKHWGMEQPPEQRGKGPYFLNGHNVYNRVKSGELSMIVLAEGPKQMMRIWEAGVDCVMSPMGSSLGEQQARALEFLSVDIFLFFDNDDAGIQASKKLTSRFLGIHEVTTVNYLDIDKRQPDDLTVGEVQYLMEEAL